MSAPARIIAMAGLAAFWGLQPATASSAEPGPPGVVVTEENRRVRMPHYSFQAPVSRGWTLQRHGGAGESVELNRESGPVRFRVQVYWAPVLDSDLRALGAREAANHVRQSERQIMLEAGVKPGLYELHDLVMSEEEIKGRTFYTMEYRTLAPSAEEQASLYLFFPKASGNGAFLMAHFSASAPPSFGLVKPKKPDFIGMLETLELQ